ncbi:MAG: DUF368 domain-containing protein [Desulfovibrionaceae bacterium]
MNLKQAWLASPGPDTWKEAGLLWLKGVCMGAADIIPGVSGGTIAFITNIYDQLMAAIKSFGLDAAKRLLRLDFSGALSLLHVRFLLPLLLGIVTALVGMARLMHHLLATYPVQVWALFFGLIAASIVVVAGRVGQVTLTRVAFCLAGAVGSYLLVGLIPVTTPENYGFLFLCGAVAICAMILPGISGAFILLLLGKYEYVTGALKAPFSGENPLIIIVFALGAGVGIISFARLLHWFMQRHYGPAVSLLTGFMIGAMRKVWPWKEVLETRLVGAREIVISERNILPAAFDSEVLWALALILLGCAAVLLLERLSKPVQPR